MAKALAKKLEGLALTSRLRAILASIKGEEKPRQQYTIPKPWPGVIPEGYDSKKMLAMDNAVVAMGQFAYSYGGWDQAGFLGYAFVMLNDLHVYDTANFSWKDLSKSVTGNAPSARSGHGFTSALGQLYVQGGWNKIGEQDKCTPIADLEVESKFQILRSLSLHLNSASLV